MSRPGVGLFLSMAVLALALLVQTDRSALAQARDDSRTLGVGSPARIAPRLAEFLDRPRYRRGDGEVLLAQLSKFDGVWTGQSDGLRIRLTVQGSEYDAIASGFLVVARSVAIEGDIGPNGRILNSRSFGGSGYGPFTLTGRLPNVELGHRYRSPTAISVRRR